MKTKSPPEGGGFFVEKKLKCKFILMQFLFSTNDDFLGASDIILSAKDVI